MTASAPAAIAVLANSRWRPSGGGDRSTPQWKVAITTSARLRAARTPAAISSGVAGCVPALVGPA